MIVNQEVIDAIRLMRRIGTDTQRWEVKKSVQELPKNLPETISAFSNMHGGMIILGLEENNKFRSAVGFDADKIYKQLQTIGDRFTPVVRMEIEKVPFEGQTIVVARVNELPKDRKPCFITARGCYEGSFIRSGGGDRHLTSYEVDRLLEERHQPQHDIEPVEQASLNDLDQDSLKAIVKRAKELFPRVFGKLDDEVILIQLGVCTRVEGQLHPTLAGLLATGVFPQQYFPRLEVVFTVYAGTTKEGNLKTGERYVDSKEIVGSIPNMLMETLSLLQQRMNTGAVIQGGLRKDIPDYPLIAVREAVANALQHRDYSQGGRGSQVQVNLYSDRLEIINPGGLYGSTTVESLGKEGISSTRNEFLSRLLTYTPYDDGYVVENKGTGFMTIESSLASALMPPPKVLNSLTYFKLTFEKRRKTAEEISDRSWKNLESAILSELEKLGSVSTKELMTMSGYSRQTIINHVNRMVQTGLLEPIEPRNSPKQRYRLVRK
ncbi:ATP-binding protein [Parasutterella secunda]|uniref:DNA binding domain-containing protein n=1 Tax=Parasutterella secunda TaxID=626947 RepID=A0ABS2GR42_9BURK|nr:ATP-binding protein [Parasutterella secunda]MBM6927919.1 putative DNA binding domain-containing protein [Parasutterella secunda]